MNKLLKKIAACFTAFVMMFLTVGSVSVAADGITYSITVKNTNEHITMVGNQYDVYKIFDATYSGSGDTLAVAYSITDSSPWYDFVTTGAGKDYVTVNKKGNVSWKENADIDAFADKAINYANELVSDSARIKPTVTSDVATGESITITVPEAGYYLVAGSAKKNETGSTETVVAACALTTAHPTAEVNVKADVPFIEKKIIEINETNQTVLVDSNNAKIDEVVEYKLTSHVPNMKGYEKYYFYIDDEMSGGLTPNKDVKIYVGGVELNSDTDYSVTYEPTASTAGTATKFRIVFVDFLNKFKDQVGAEIVITYSATVNEKAVIGDSGNPNTIKLNYSNNPNFDYKGENTPNENEPVGVTPEDTVITYVTELDITKIDSKDSYKFLEGAEFTLTGTTRTPKLTTTEKYVEDTNGTYWKLNDNTYTTTDPNGEGVNQDNYESTTQKYSKTVETTVVFETTKYEKNGVTAKDGKLSFVGLSKGTYTLTETKAPDGYNLMTEPVSITINWTAPKDPISKDSKCEWTAKKGDTDLSIENGNVKISVKNSAGVELPSTGGMGTTMLYIAGGLLVLGSVVFFMTNRKMRKD